MENMLMAKELDFVLEEYKILWDYYKKTLEQRNEMIKNYSLFMGILSAILAIIPNFVNINNKIIVVLLIAASFIGLSISFSYMSESITSRRYLRKIAEISEIITSETNIPKKIFDKSDVYNNKTVSLITSLSKCFPLSLISSLALYFAIFFANANFFASVLFSSLLLILQVIMYVVWLKNKLPINP